MKKIFAGLVLAFLCQLPLHADQNLAGNVTITGGSSVGNLNVTGTIDSDGNSVSFGTQSTGTPTVPGAIFSYADNSLPTGGADTFKSLVNRSLASWVWTNGPSGGPFVNAMRIDNAHQLLLFRSDGTTAGLTLTPQTGVIKFGTNASATLTPNDSTGAITLGGPVNITGAFTASAGITNTSGSFTGGSTGLTFTAGGTNQNITFTPGGTGNVIINGNVGIGNSVPTNRLTIGATAHTGYGLSIRNPTYGAVIETTGNTGSIAALWVRRFDDLQTLFRVDNTGNVGVGTTSPGTRFEVAGAMRATDEAGLPTTGKGIEISYQSPSDRGRIIAFDRTNGVYKPLNIEASAFYFQNGNVGIGTTNPGDKLHVFGNVLLDGYKAFVARYNATDSYRGHYAWDHLQFGNNGNNYIIAGNTAAGGALGFVVNNTNDLTGLYADMYKNGTVAMMLSSSGNVGIGTTTPATKFEVVGGQLGAETARVTTNYPSVATNGTNYVRNLGFYSWNLPIASGITDSGYRIGLDVENFVSDSNFLGTLSSQYGLWARVGSYSAGTGTIQNSYGVYIDNLDGPATVLNKYGLYQANPTAKNYFAASIGIGTAPSSAKLNVGGTLHITDGSFLHNSVHGDYEMQQLLAANNGGGTGDAALYSWVSEPGVTWTGAGIARNMRNSGVGFPRVNTGLSGQMIRFDEGAGIWFTTETSSGTRYNPMYLSGNDMIVSGNVGIGTTNPTQKLSVAGTIRAYAVVVDTGWSDYVFDKDYRLAPLSEVEAHIKAEKHLPGIPSAAEVAEHGVSVGDMQSKLLAKVEELTLHLIAQEKALTVVQSENASLRQRLATLEANQR